jgi:hypothetical protein
MGSPDCWLRQRSAWGSARLPDDGRAPVKVRGCEVQMSSTLRTFNLFVETAVCAYRAASPRSTIGSTFRLISRRFKYNTDVA